MAEEDRFCFICDWYDPHAAFIRKYQLVYYPKDCTMEMFDMKNHRPFLRRTKVETIRPEDLYIGSRVNVLSRQLTFTDYGDKFTEKRLGQKTERTLGMIKPDAAHNLGPILDSIHQAGFLVTKLKMCALSRNDAFELYKEHQSKDFFNALVGFVTSGPVIAFELMGAGAILKWRGLLGPTDSAVARSEAPMSLRARFGTDGTQNACHGSDSPQSAAREIEFFFGPGRVNTASFGSCTCAVIKPHAVLEGLSGRIISRIGEHFNVSAIEMFTMEKADVEEFYEVYKGVVQEYPEMVKELTSGPCIAVEIKAKGGEPVQGDAGNTAKSFREFVGPADPEIARHLRPNTLRAHFGKDKVQNALHCTDLPEDGLLEVEYFFKILSQ